MKLGRSVRSISYLKAHASEIVREVTQRPHTYVITQNGEAKAVVQDIASYDAMQESLALLSMLARSSKSVREGRYKPARTAFRDLAAKIKSLK
jgi:prevent-host-death family protein